MSKVETKLELPLERIFDSSSLLSGQQTGFTLACYQLTDRISINQRSTDTVKLDGSFNKSPDVQAWSEILFYILISNDLLKSGD